MIRETFAWIKVILDLFFVAFVILLGCLIVLSPIWAPLLILWLTGVFG